MDCFGTYFTHVQTCDVTRAQVLRNVYCGTYFTHAQTCNVTRVQSATEWGFSTVIGGYLMKSSELFFQGHCNPTFISAAPLLFFWAHAVHARGSDGHQKRFVID